MCWSEDFTHWCVDEIKFWGEVLQEWWAPKDKNVEDLIFAF